LPNGDELIAFSQSDLNPIDGFKGHNYDWTGNTWRTYGDNYLVFKSFNDSSAKIVGVSEAKYFGTADTRYCDEEIYDSIFINKYFYVLGKFCRNGEYGEVYDGLAVYRIPLDKISRKNINIEDFAKPLF